MNIKDRLSYLIYSFFLIDKKEHPAPPMAQGVLTSRDKTPPPKKSDDEDK